MSSSAVKFAFLLALPFSLPAQPVDSPVQVLNNFYGEYKKLRITGLPDKTEAQKLRTFLSSALQTAIGRAQAEQARCIKAAPDEKGPWVEGDMFSSNFEGFASMRVDDAKPSKASRRRLTVNFEYVENGQKFPWADEVELIQQGNHWVIDDVLYRRKSAFGNGFGASIRKSLSGKGC